MNKLNEVLENVVSTEKLKRLYILLDKEENPFDVSISNLKKGQKKIVLKTNTENAKYFADLLVNL